MRYFDPNGQCISFFDVCCAYQLLEAHYNVGGWLRERPSNKRRMESIGCQLHRMQYVDNHRTVDLTLSQELLDLDGDDGDEAVRWVYFSNVLRWNLPIADEDRSTIERLFVRDYIVELRPDFFKEQPDETPH